MAQTPPTESPPSSPDAESPSDAPTASERSETSSDRGEREIGGRDGPEPTRFGDWEKNGRCIDF
ncbi:MAG: DUF1674 domain-containing protein [Pseudomonadota bacterium]